MEPRLGLRLVRGPDWCWGDQDGGVGCVGTVVEVGEAGTSVMVQWDLGTRALYRCGEDDKFDLRVFDAAPTDIKGVAGIHWQCTNCYEYHLCHSCYLLGRHCQEHPFFRVESKEQAARVKVSCRAGAKRVRAKGVFVGAEVVRGPHWSFGDQDGGAGKTGRVVAIEGWKTATFRSVAKVEWSAGGPANIYRVGHKGKVDLRCTSPASGGYYNIEHLAILGLSAAVTVFDEEEIVAGDFVKVELDPEVFKMMQKAAGLWSDDMTAVLYRTLLVLSIMEEQRLYAFSGSNYIMCTDSVTKLKHCRVGQTVRVTSDVSLLRQQHGGGIWNEEMVTIVGQIGCLTKVYINNRVQVYVEGRGWLLDPLCLEPAPGETASYTSDPNNENSSFSNKTRNDIREVAVAAGLTDEALLSGDLKTVESLVYNNETLVQMKEALFQYYAMIEMADAFRLCLQSGICQQKIDVILSASLTRNLTETLTVMIEEGAVARSGARLLMTAVACTSPSIVRALATAPGVMLDAQSSGGNTAMHITTKCFRHIPAAIMLAAGANPTICSGDTVCAIHDGAVKGNVAIMEVLVVHAKEYLNLSTPDGYTPLHYAASKGHTQVCSLLAAQASVNINHQFHKIKASPLHLAIEESHWSVVECLVGWGALLNLIDRDGDTPLHRVIRLKSFNSPKSPQIQQVREELSVASGGRAVKGYIAVACFLVREGADWLVKNKEGVSPHQALPPVVAEHISEYLKKLPELGAFHGSLRREQQQRKLQELPLQLKLPPPVPSSAVAAAVSGTATDNLSRKTEAESISKASYEATEIKSGLLAKTKFDKKTESMVQPSGVSRQPCLLCEDHPASIRFSPCGHTVLCSRCAERAKKCLRCKAYVESKSIEQL